MALGPVDVGDGETITSRNAVATLLNGVYLKYPTDVVKQDDVFENAARRIFDATVDRARATRWPSIRALVRGVSERRIMLWSRTRRRAGADPARAPLRISRDRHGRPQVGVFVNDGGAAKMAYYLTMGTRVRSEQCFDNDSQELRITTTLRHNAPANTPSSCRMSVTGFGDVRHTGSHAASDDDHRTPRRHHRLHDGRRAAGAERGRQVPGPPVATVARQLPPGRSSVIVTTMRTAALSPGDPELRTTPGVLPNADAAGASACE